MTRLYRVLCPVDFSAPSQAALRYAIAIAEHHGSRLTVMIVADPLLAKARAAHGDRDSLADAWDRELRRFVDRTMDDRAAFALEVEYLVAGGNPAAGILQATVDRQCNLVVMSTHGLSGTRKPCFGPTTGQVLRETTVPVLVTPPHEPGPLHVDQIASLVRRMLTPMDLSAVGERHVQAAAGLAATLEVPLLLTHVVEPLRPPIFAVTQPPCIDNGQRMGAEQALEGPPRERGAALIVVGPQAAPLAGPRVGSVTHRVLRLGERLVLALPPADERLRRASPAVSSDVIGELLLAAR